MSAKLFLTGANNEFGVKVLRSVIDKYSVTLFSNRWDKVPQDLLSKANLVTGEIVEVEKIKTACKGAQVALHFAWETQTSAQVDPSIYDILSEELCSNGSISKPSYLLTKSSIYTPGVDKTNHHTEVSEFTENLTTTGYSRSRLENHALSKANQLLNVGVFRPAWYYGCNSSFDYWIKQIQTKKAITYTNDLNTYIPLVHAQDAADLATLLVEGRASGQFFAVEKSLQLFDILALLRGKFGYDLKMYNEEYFSPKMLGIVMKKYYSLRAVSLAANKLGWKPAQNFDDYIRQLKTSQSKAEPNFSPDL